IDTLGSPLNAVTQIGDLAFAMYKGGTIRGLKDAGKSFIGKSRITKEDLGFAKRDIMAELEQNRLSSILDTIFKITGFNKMDRLGAEGLVNATIGKAQREAAENSPKLRKELEVI